MRIERILAEFYGTPLALLPEKIEAIRFFLHRRAKGEEVSDAEVAEVIEARRSGDIQMVGRVAVMPVFGTISQRVGMMERASGGISTEQIGADLDSLLNDRGVRSVVMVYHSPGGSVFGVPELAAKIRAGRDQKRIVAFADSMAASAAYWLAAQASELVVTPAGQVGSVGVYSAHEDMSGYYEQMGVKTTLVSAGEFKTEGNPYGPLEEQAKGEMQAKVNHYYGMFVKDLAKGRNTTEAKVRADFGKGRMMTADAAVAAGMADRVATLDNVLKRLGAYEGASASPPAIREARALLAEKEGL